MKLHVDLSPLHEAVAPMRNYKVKFELDKQLGDLPEIEIFVEKIRPSDIQFENGFVVHKGSPVRLYIEDHGNSYEDALSDRESRRKVHVVDCKTLQKMRAEGRFERYVVTNKLDDCLTISGQRYDGRNDSAEVELDVCKMCLNQLNYQGATLGTTQNRQSIVDNFSITEFLETYSTLFNALPKRRAGDGSSNGYTADWPNISRELRIRRGYRCESCSVDLAEHRKLCHVHHKNGVKTENCEENLAVLCIDCHRKQPHHATMWVSAAQMKIIRQLRREAEVALIQSWDEAFELVDTAGRDALDLFKSKDFPLPVIGYEIMHGSRVAGELEFAWPVKKVGVSKTSEDSEAAKKNDWKIFELFDVVRSLRDIRALV